MAENNGNETGSGRKRKWKYHIMLLADNDKGEIKQMGIDQIFVEILAAIIVIALTVTIIGWVNNSSKLKEKTAESERLTAQVADLSNQNDGLRKENEELSTKISVLVDTVNNKVEKENTIKQEVDEAHYPEGFPISASASMTADENDPNTIIFTCSEGANVIATGTGTVIEITPDNDYGYCIRIDHENGYITEYYCAATPLIKKGDAVVQGSVLSSVEGKDAKVIYKVLLDDKPIDPMTVIRIDG